MGSIGLRAWGSRGTSDPAVTLREQIERAAEWIAGANHVVAFTGAGISTDSGIPDFRGPDGVWTRRDAGLAPPAPRVPRSQWKPNKSHDALVDLHRLGKLQFLISQNVDNLHLASGIPDDILAELHGNGKLMRCTACDRQFPFEVVGWDKSVWGDGYRTQGVRPGQPACPKCGERVISSIVNFDDPMPRRELDMSFAQSARCDVFFAIGSSLVVSPANDMPRVAVENGAKLILLNLGETPLDDAAHLHLEASIGDVLPPVVELVRTRLG